MSNSTTYLCNKVIQDIIKAGKQQLSDRRTLKLFLSRAVLDNKKIVNNELVKQTGIKSQYCTINNQLSPEPIPNRMNKDQYMCKSVQKMHKKYVANKLIAKSNNNMKTNSKVAKSKFIQKNKKEDNNNEDSKLRDKSNNKKLQISVQCIKLQSQIRRQKQQILHLEEQKLADKLRNAWFNKQKSEREDYQNKIVMQKKREQSYNKTKSNFIKNVKSGDNQFTFHTNGDFLLYSKKGKQKQIITNNFPQKLTPKLYEQKFLLKRQHQKPKSNHANQTSPQKKNEIIQNVQAQGQKQSPRKSSHQQKQSNFNNNQKRQTSSVNYLQINPGICYTEPSLGKTLRGETTKSEFYSTSRGKKSSFSMFFNQKDQSKSDGFEGFKQQNSNKRFRFFTHSNFGYKNTFMSGCSGQWKSQKRQKQPGQIKDVNQKLLKQMITHDS